MHTKCYWFKSLDTAYLTCYFIVVPALLLASGLSPPMVAVIYGGKQPMYDVFKLKGFAFV